MKNTILALLVVILLVAVANLLAALGIFGGSGAASGSSAGHEYKVLNALQMDDLGFRTIAEEEGIEVGEDGQINFPKEMVDKIAKVNLLPRTILEVEKDGGWEFLAVTGDDHYLFKRSK